MHTHTAYIGLGSNLGDRRANLLAAVEMLRAHPAIGGVELSRFYNTLPVGGPPGQGEYLNAAARLRTELGPEELLALLQRIEQALGRVRVERWGPRTIDLDLLLYDREVIESGTLTLPHPRMHERGFVLQPLAEVGAEAVHPGLGCTVRELLARLSREGESAIPT